MIYQTSEIQVFVAGLDHPEGVAVAPDGTVYAGGEAGQVYRISPGGQKVEIVAQTGGSCLGITLDGDGGIIVCDAGRREVLKVGQQREIQVLTKSSREHELKNPNFSVYDSHGICYFSDSGEWKKANGVIYRILRTGTVEVFSEGPFHFPNGLALDRVERYLYVVESNLDRVLSISIGDDGKAAAPEVFVEGIMRVPDGLAFDSRQNLYVTTYASNCVYRVTPDRKIELLCRDPENVALCQPTNCAFGGPNFNRLFVANLGRDHLAVLDIGIKGQRLWCHRKWSDNEGSELGSAGEGLRSRSPIEAKAGGSDMRNLTRSAT